MKKILILLTIALSLVLINHSCKPEPEPEPELPGSIYGVVTDKATGEPVKNANVQLRPSGVTTLTGVDGRYDFQDVKNGDYNIIVSKTGYTDLIDDYVITVEDGKDIRRDVQIEKLPAALRVVDDNGKDISELDFGSSNDDLSRMFSIFNDGVGSLTYAIVKTAKWITSISSENGTLQAGATMPIVMVIDRDIMSVGDNTTTIHITSNDGSKQMTIKAKKISDISTLDAESVGGNWATLKASINRDVLYSERGFYYGTNANNMTKVTVDGGGMGTYTYKLNNLKPGIRYYYKAYMVCDNQTSYGEVKEFTTKSAINGHEYVDLALPSGLKWATCNAGASSPEGYGNYYTFDEACDLTWGGTWRTPTKAEFEELRNACSWKWTTQNNVYGYKVTGTNGNSIFLPAAGYRSGSSISNAGSRGYYWSSTPSEYDSYYLYFHSDAHYMNDDYSKSGQSVRPVLE